MTSSARPSCSWAVRSRRAVVLRRRPGLAGAPGGVGPVALSQDELAEWVVRSCAAQGVPVKVGEARTVEQVRVLLTGQAGVPKIIRTRWRRLVG